MEFGSDYQALTHHWVYNNDHSECYGNRMFSENNKIYSYGYHYLMAQKVKDKHGTTVYILNSDTYSKMTTKQMRTVVKAIPQSSKIFYTSGAHLSPPNNIEELINEIEFYCDKEARAISIDYVPDITIALSNLITYTNSFKLDRRKFTKHLKYLLTLNADELSKESLETLIITVTGIRNDRVRIARKAKKKNDKKVVERYNQNLKEWLNFDKNYINLPFGYNFEIRLRYNPNTMMIETSNSAELSVRYAKILHTLVSSGKNVIGTKLGDFTVISVGDSYTIGCTLLTKKVMNDMCRQLSLKEVF